MGFLHHPLPAGSILPLPLEVDVRIFFFHLFHFHLFHRGRTYPARSICSSLSTCNIFKPGLLASEASLSAVAINSRMPGTQTLLPSPFSVTFCFSRWEIHFKPKELIENPVGVELKIYTIGRTPKSSVGLGSSTGCTTMPRYNQQ